jgi:hypothetical protein
MNTSENETESETVDTLARQIKYFWDGESRLALFIPPLRSEPQQTLEVFAGGPAAVVHLFSIEMEQSRSILCNLVLPEGCSYLHIYAAREQLALIAMVIFSAEWFAAAKAEGAIHPEEPTKSTAAPASGSAQAATASGQTAPVFESGAWTLVGEASRRPWVLDKSNFRKDELPEGAIFTQKYEMSGASFFPVQTRLRHAAFEQEDELKVRITATDYRTTESRIAGGERETSYVPCVQIYIRSADSDQIDEILRSLTPFHISAQCMRLRVLAGPIGNGPLRLVFGRAKQPTALQEPSPRGRGNAERPASTSVAVLTGISTFGGLEESGGYIAHIEPAHLGRKPAGAQIQASRRYSDMIEIEYCEAALGDEIGVYPAPNIANIEGLLDKSVHGWRVMPQSPVEVKDEKELWERVNRLRAEAEPGFTSAVPQLPTKRRRRTLETAFVALATGKDAGGRLNPHSALDPALFALSAHRSSTEEANDAVIGISPQLWVCIAARVADSLKIPRAPENPNWTVHEQVSYWRIVSTVKDDPKLKDCLIQCGFVLSPCPVAVDTLRSALDYLQKFPIGEIAHGTEKFIAKAQQKAAASVSKNGSSADDVVSVKAAVAYILAVCSNRTVTLEQVKKTRRGLELIMQFSKEAGSIFDPLGPAEANTHPPAPSEALDLIKVIRRTIDSEENSNVSICKILVGVELEMQTLSELRKIKQRLHDSRAKDPYNSGRVKLVENLARALQLDPATPGVEVIYLRPESNAALSNMSEVWRDEIKSFLLKSPVAPDITRGFDESLDVQILMASAAYCRLKKIAEDLETTGKSEAERRKLQRGLDRWPLRGRETWNEFGKATVLLKEPKASAARAKA